MYLMEAMLNTRFSDMARTGSEHTVLHTMVRFEMIKRTAQLPGTGRGKAYPLYETSCGL